MQVERVVKFSLGLDMTLVCITECAPCSGGQRWIASHFGSGSCLKNLQFVFGT